jgi:hypothetical protein
MCPYHGYSLAPVPKIITALKGRPDSMPTRMPSAWSIPCLHSLMVVMYVSVHRAKPPRSSDGSSVALCRMSSRKLLTSEMMGRFTAVPRQLPQLPPLPPGPLPMASWLWASCSRVEVCVS